MRPSLRTAGIRVEGITCIVCDWLPALTEGPLSNWFKQNFRLLGFVDWAEELTPKYARMHDAFGLSKKVRPDFFALDEWTRRWKRVEIERFSSEFAHGSDYAEVLLAYFVDSYHAEVEREISLVALLGAKNLCFERRINNEVRRVETLVRNGILVRKGS